MVPLTVIIPTYNEQANLRYALNSVVGWANQIIVVDSGSTDQTVEIANSFGVEVFEHPYENMAAQRMWALHLPHIKHEWVFNLDADEYLTKELRTEISEALQTVEPDVSGFLIRRKHIFLGRWMKHGGDYLWLLRLVRRKKCRIIKTQMVNEHTIVDGRVVRLHNDFVHENHKSLTEWIHRQNNGSRKFALGFLEASSRGCPALRPSECIEGSMRTFLNYAIYGRLPLFVRPFVRFIVFYFLRLGFLDGWQGFVYHTINDFIYPFFVYAKFKEYAESETSRLEAAQAKWR